MKPIFSELNFLIWLPQNPKKHLPKKFQNLDWSTVYKYAPKNKLLPFFHHIINCPLCQKKIPKRELEKFRKALLKALAFHLIQEKEKNRLEEKLDRLKIKAVLLKDTQAYNIKYPSSIFPQKIDLDFFIPKISQKKIKVLKLLLKKLGYKYRPHPRNKFLTKFDRLALDYEKKTNSLPLVIDFHLEKILPEGMGKVNPVTEDVNDKFTSMFNRSIHKNGNYFLASKELHLLFWSWHFFFRDSFRGLKTLFDIAQFCKQKKLDWEKMIKIAKKFNLLSYFLFVVAIADQVYKINPPKKVIETIEKNRKVRIALKLYSPLLTAYGQEEFPQENKAIEKYSFLIKLILWERPIIYKIGPRALFYSLYYLPKTFFILKRETSPNFS